MEPARIPGNGGANPDSGVPVPTHPSSDLCTIHVCPTTGGGFDISVLYQDTIDSIKKTIAKRLKLSKERISLLYKDRILKEGSVLSNALYEGCRLTLLPHVESGLISQRNENSVMQALENLTESQQVNDFLSGKAPLTLAMRLGDHMMFVQLQLSTSPPGSKHRTTTSSSSRASSSSSTSSSAATSAASSASLSSSSSTASASPSSSRSHPAPSTSASPSSIISSLPSLLSSRPPKVLPSPIPIKPTPVFPSSPSSTCSSPASSAPSSPALSGFSSGPPSPASSTSSFGSPLPSPLARSPSSPSSGSESDGSQPPSPTTPTSPMSMPVLDSSALAQASRNLSQKLRELSQASTHTKDSTEDKSSLRSSGAIIESMYHHGQGVFSGTFSGTLNPALQDTDGKPRRSVSTIVHILNDLLGATPQYRARMTPRGRSTTQRLHRSPRHHATPSSASRRAYRTSGDHLQMSSENRALKGKVQHIQQMLEERRRRLRARRQARSSPYPACWSGINRTDVPVSSMTHQPMDVDTSSTPANGHSDSHADSASYTQIKQEPVMA